jgi:GAF domain-containing protein
MIVDKSIIPANESERLAALKRYEILDTPPDGSFENLTKLATKLFGMPIAIISLVDEHRIWFKSHCGVDASQIDRAPGLCASAILSQEMYVVENAIEDPRTLTNPLVTGSLGLRFYAAAPLITKDGYGLGTFCIIDSKQRYLTENQKDMLQSLADIVMDEMELRLSARKLLENTSNHLKAAVKEFESVPELRNNERVRTILQTSKKLAMNIDERLNVPVPQN